MFFGVDRGKLVNSPRFFFMQPDGTRKEKGEGYQNRKSFSCLLLARRKWINTAHICHGLEEGTADLGRRIP